MNTSFQISFKAISGCTAAKAAFFVSMLGILAASLASAQTPALGSEFQVNSHTTDIQAYPTVGIDPDGNFVVAWQGYGQDGPSYGVLAQRFASSGEPLGEEFQVNSYTPETQGFPNVGVDGIGNFVIVWQDYSGQDGSGAGIVGQRFDSDGIAQGIEFQINTYTTSWQRHPNIGMNASGAFVVVWQSFGPDGSDYAIAGRRYDSTGTPQGDEFLVNTYTTDTQLFPAAGMDGSGNFVVVWQSSGPDGSDFGVFGRRYDSSGVPQGDEFGVNTYTLNAQDGAFVGVDDSGGFVVVWQSPDGEDGAGVGAFGRRYDSAGIPQGTEFRVGAGTHGSPSVSMRDGNFVVIMYSYSNGGFGVSGQRYGSSGLPEGSEFQIRPYTADFIAWPRVAMNSSGNFVSVWRSALQDGSDDRIFGKRGDWHGARQTTVDIHGMGDASNLNGVLEPGETVVIEPTWKNTFAVPLTLTGTASNLTGPPGPGYSIDDASADYGSVDPGSMTDCYDATPGHDCYQMTLSGSRPVAHWDATFDEALTDGFSKTWTLHIGESFPDVAASDPFYAYVENIFHNAITAGCAAGDYCLDDSVTRAQMAVFLLKAAHGSAFVPPACTGSFGDVPCPSLFADWIEELSTEGITAGCGGGDYCPGDPVTRAQMAVFLLKAEHGLGYSPPSCAGAFPDVPCPSLFADWIEQLSAENVTGGCGGGNYCPDNPNTRGQMAVFLVKTFGLQLYGP